MRTKKACIAAILISLTSFLVSTVCFGQQIPAPGTVIDKDNYKQYEGLFPPEYIPAFVDGFGGLMIPQKIKVVETKSHPMASQFVALSEQNKGKYSLSSGGHILGGWKRMGLPFPDLDKSDKEFATKLMWNYAGRYQGDEEKNFCYNVQLRKGEAIRWNMSNVYWIYFVNRLVNDPKPLMENPMGVSRTVLIEITFPESLKNTMTQGIRFMDPLKADELYAYVPSLRKVVRNDETSVTAPVVGSMTALDDMDGFDGKTNEFTYTFVGEQKVLADLGGNALGRKFLDEVKKGNKLFSPVSQGSIRDAYVVDIVSRNPAYPQSRKRIWLDKENLCIFWAVSYDKADKPWKIWNNGWTAWEMKGVRGVKISNALTMDLQEHFMTNSTWEFKVNPGGMSWVDFSPSAMVRRARQ
jgi:hypothetical protein